MRENKKLWLAPIVITLVLVGVLLLLANLAVYGWRQGWLERGRAVSNVPRVGSIAWWGTSRGGGYGHVAIVVAVAIPIAVTVAVSMTTA